MQAAIRLSYSHFSAINHSGNDTINRYQSRNKKATEKKTSATRAHNGFLTERIYPVVSDIIIPPHSDMDIDLSTGECLDYLYKSAIRYAGLLGSELPYRKPRRCKTYRFEIANLYKALDSILADPVNIEFAHGNLSFCVYRYHEWPSDTLFWMPIDFTERLPHKLKQVTLEFIRQFICHHRMQKITDSLYYDMMEDFFTDTSSMDKKERLKLKRLKESYRKGKVFVTLNRMRGKSFCSRLEEKLETIEATCEVEKELLALIREGVEFIREDSPCIMDYEYDWGMEENPDFFPITLQDQIAYAYSINDNVVKEMECYINSMAQETYALIPVSSLILTPDTESILRTDNFPECFAGWFDRFVCYINDNLK